jgi:hypothetical protein
MTAFYVFRDDQLFQMLGEIGLPPGSGAPDDIDCAPIASKIIETVKRYAEPWSFAEPGHQLLDDESATSRLVTALKAAGLRNHPPRADSIVVYGLNEDPPREIASGDFPPAPPAPARYPVGEYAGERSAAYQKGWADGWDAGIRQKAAEKAGSRAAGMQSAGPALSEDATYGPEGVEDKP